MAPHPFNSILKDPMVAAPPPPVMQWQYKLPGGLGLLATVEEYYQSKDYANTDKEMVDVEEDKVDDGDINATDFNDNNNNDGSAPAEVWMYHDVAIDFIHHEHHLWGVMSEIFVQNYVYMYIFFYNGGIWCRWGL